MPSPAETMKSRKNQQKEKKNISTKAQQSSANPSTRELRSPQRCKTQRSSDKQPKTIRNNQNQQKATKRANSKKPQAPKEHQNALKITKTALAPQSVPKAPRPYQNPPKTLPKPSPDPPKSLPRATPNSLKIAIFIKCLSS